jgi:hypothetical protein
MNVERLMNIALIVSAMMLAIATLLAPSLAEMVKARIAQPKITPDTNNTQVPPPHVPRNVGILIAITIVLASLVNYWAMHKLPPSERFAVYYVAASISIVVFSIFIFFWSRFVSFINLVNREQGEVNEALTLNQRIIIDILIAKHPETIDDLKPASESLDALITKYIVNDQPVAVVQQ